MKTDVEAPLAATLGSTTALATSLLGFRVGVEGVDAVPTAWNRLIGVLSGYTNARVRLVVQLLIVVKLIFLVALESRDDLLHWNSAVLICIWWHLYCLLASEAIARSVGREQLVGIPSIWMLGIALGNCLQFLVYLIVFWVTQPDLRQLGFDHLPLGVLIQVYPFPTSSPWALVWGVALAFVRIPMMLTWSLSLHLLTSKILGALSMPDPRVYTAPNVCIPDRVSSEPGAGDTLRRRSVELMLAEEFKQPIHSSELKYRFRHYCSLAERLKAVGRDVNMLATVVWCGQLGWSVFALNCLVLGEPFSMGPFLIFYVFVMVLYVVYMLYSFWSLVSVIHMMQYEFLSIIDKDLLALDLDKQMELVRDNLQIRQVVLESRLGVGIFRGSILIENGTMIRLLAFFASVFFVLIKIKRGSGV